MAEDRVQSSPDNVCNHDLSSVQMLQINKSVIEHLFLLLGAVAAAAAGACCHCPNHLPAWVPHSCWRPWCHKTGVDFITRPTLSRTYTLSLPTWKSFWKSMSEPMLLSLPRRLLRSPTCQMNLLTAPYLRCPSLLSLSVQYFPPPSSFSYPSPSR